MQTHFQAFFNAANLLTRIMFTVLIQIRTKSREIIAREFLVQLRDIHDIRIAEQCRNLCGFQFGK